VSQPEIILGIDLGTSFSTAAAWVQGKLYLVPDKRGEPCIPSIVHFPHQGEPIVGHEAERYRAAEPDATVSGVKRILGRMFDTSEVTIMAAHSAIAIRPAENGTPILGLRTGNRTPPEVASHIFRFLRARAEERFQTPARRAVVTLPATADEKVREATIHAAKMAGIEVLRTLTEPSAAAIAYHMDRVMPAGRLLVYDFGGGTFDVTVLEQSASGFRTLVTGGDPCLGGDDLDHALAHQIASFIYRSQRIDLTKDVVRWDRVVRQAERTKRALSASSIAKFRLPKAYSAQRKTQDLDLNVHRDDIMGRWQPLIDRSTKATAQTVMKGGLRPKDLEHTVLVGGTAFVPAVQRAVAKLLGGPAKLSDNPQTAVACGAAVVAARLVKTAA
jgi:molecular chaperone DnaK